MSSMRLVECVKNFLNLKGIAHDYNEEEGFFVVRWSYSPIRDLDTPEKGNDGSVRILGIYCVITPDSDEIRVMTAVVVNCGDGDAHQQLKADEHNWLRAMQYISHTNSIHAGYGTSYIDVARDFFIGRRTALACYGGDVPTLNSIDEVVRDAVAPWNCYGEGLLNVMYADAIPLDEVTKAHNKFYGK